MMMAYLNKLTTSNFEKICACVALPSFALPLDDLVSMVLVKCNEDTKYIALLVRMIDRVLTQRCSVEEAEAVLERTIRTRVLIETDDIWSGIEAASPDASPGEDYDLFCALIKRRAQLLNAHRMSIMLCHGSEFMASRGMDRRAVESTLATTTRAIDAVFNQLPSTTAAGVPCASLMNSIDLALECLLNVRSALPSSSWALKTADMRSTLQDIHRLVAQKALLTSRCRFKAIHLLETFGYPV